MSASPETLVRLCSEQEWSDAREGGWIRPEGGDSGTAAFVHLSTPQQVHLPANRLYAGRRDLVLLYIDAAALAAPVRWETGVPGDPESMLFPHLYGALPVAAVRQVVAYPPEADGTFPPLQT
ncbi:DUF952 domain-containing protein [Mycobacterium vicinigordonae]|uniref:DUF952 domain-containing protein n=1 Tax=Mycobacterium vicinigordonae TaxID=1719132 RepID=A0A7D6E1E9_9MYCO|nr:DUF952 domain-containing protein [Mycobacterium vicinigordonae]QLL09368.1 DUF952 domain-containing protein [Mycobacterium vicinigordonae]